MRISLKQVVVGLLVCVALAIYMLSQDALHVPSAHSIDAFIPGSEFREVRNVSKDESKHADLPVTPGGGGLAGMPPRDQPRVTNSPVTAGAQVTSASPGELSHDQMKSRALRNAFPGADPEHLHGRIGYLSNGSPAWSPLPPLMSESFQEKVEHHKGNCFNLRRSDAIPLDRHLDDMRHNDCRSISYPDDLPVASVVFVFYNEPASPLYRSIHSVLNRTPPHLLHEIVLVDDCSDADHLKEPFEQYLQTLPKIKLVRLTKRSGLMTARTEGAKAATGEVVVFLDSHIECTQGWMEPLLTRIKEDRKHVVMPIIDSIDADFFSYRRGGIDILGFHWRLGQEGLARARHPTNPMPSVIMAGGLFAIDRKLFFEIGAYDPEMQLYGGEEMEISFRIWQCGMTLECIPCSRVGHVFRSGAYWKGQVYSVPSQVIARNKLRAAEVWMDEYKEIVFDLMEPAEGIDLGPLEYMYDIRKRLQCKSFKWFLENVYPERDNPFAQFKPRIKGEIRNPSTATCFDTLGATTIASKVGVYPCHGLKGTQFFIYTDTRRIIVPSSSLGVCIDRGEQLKELKLWHCHNEGTIQEWIWDQSSGHLTDKKHEMCITVSAVPSPASPYTLELKPCMANSPVQEWKIISQERPRSSSESIP
jgi:polypeptide N-acetylgalactosaminyltransferase